MKRWGEVGSTAEICAAVVRYRLRDNQQGIKDSTILPDTVSVTDDVVAFTTAAGVPLNDPEKYKEMTGRNGLVRTTMYKLFLNAGDGYVVGVYGSFGDDVGGGEVKVHLILLYTGLPLSW